MTNGGAVNREVNKEICRTLQSKEGCVTKCIGIGVA